MEKDIFLTRPILPPLEDLIPHLQQIWGSRFLTNGAQYHQEFEHALCEFLGVKYCSLFCNGTTALLTAFQALSIKGEVITTPFSFAATSHAILWNRSTPIFCDIDPKTFNIDVNKIEPLITPKTTAIVPVHIYGNPCNLNKLQEIADAYNLRLIYDAAQAFGVKKNGTSILNYGDLSILSFHATKVFNTFEGGAIICSDSKTKEHIDYLKNFGFANEETVILPGLNGKMNEFSAALGLLQLNHIDDAIQARKNIYQNYATSLKDIAGLGYLPEIENVEHNYSYFPITVDENIFPQSRDELYATLKQHKVHARKYFSPLISQFSSYCDHPSASPNNLPIAEHVAKQVLCLPIYPELEKSGQDMIIDIVLNSGKN